jgi:subtilase family serine protease
MGDIKFGNTNEKNVSYGNINSIISNKSNPSISTGNGVYKPIGEKDFNKIGFGISTSDPQKYPAPISKGSDKLEDIVKKGTIWSYPTNDNKFGKK